jgi:hypothetical protein
MAQLVEDRGLVHTSALFENYKPTLSSTRRKNTSERAELVRYFFDHAAKEWTMPSVLTPRRIALKLSHLSMFDLYAFKKILEDKEKAGYPWSRAFWGMLKIK